MIASALAVGISSVGFVVSVFIELNECGSSPSLDVMFEPKLVTLSNVHEGVYTLPVKLLNNSPDFVRVLGYKASCSCSKVDVERNWLSPGESIDIKCEWDLRGKSGMAKANITLNFERKTETSSESNFLSLNLPLRAEVRPLWWIEPQIVSFQRQSAGSSEVGIFASDTSNRIDIVSASASHPALTVHTLSQSRIRLTFDPEKFVRSGPVSLNISTNSAVVPNKTFPIWIKHAEKEHHKN